MEKGYVAVMVSEEPGEEPEVTVTDLYEDAWLVTKYMQDSIEEGKYTSGKILELDTIPKEKEEEPFALRRPIHLTDTVVREIVEEGKYTGELTQDELKVANRLYDKLYQ